MKVGRNDILILRPEPFLIFDKSEDVSEWADGKSSPKPGLPFWARKVQTGALRRKP